MTDLTPAQVEDVLSYLYGQTLWESQSDRAKKAAREDAGAVLRAAVAVGWVSPSCRQHCGRTDCTDHGCLEE